MQTMVRAWIALNETEFLLAPGQDVAELRRRMEGAMRSGGGFVEFVVAGDRSVSALITSATQIVISVEKVDLDARDSGGSGALYGGEFDLL